MASFAALQRRTALAGRVLCHVACASRANKPIAGAALITAEKIAGGADLRGDISRPTPMNSYRNNLRVISIRKIRSTMPSLICAAVCWNKSRRTRWC